MIRRLLDIVCGRHDAGGDGPLVKIGPDSARGKCCDCPLCHAATELYHAGSNAREWGLQKHNSAQDAVGDEHARRLDASLAGMADALAGMML